MKLYDAEFTIFDVETTGLSPYGGDKICEIAAIRMGSKRRTTFHSLVDPERAISYGAFRVNGITYDMIEGHPTIDKVLPDFLEFIRGSVLVAYNAGFDLGFIESALGDKRDILKDYHVVDALVLARRLFPHIGRYNLGFVSRSLGIRSGRQHRAMSDALMTLKIFEKELKVMADGGAYSVEDISRITGCAGPLKSVKDYKVRLIKEAIHEQEALNIVTKPA